MKRRGVKNDDEVKRDIFKDGCQETSGSLQRWITSFVIFFKSRHFLRDRPYSNFNLMICVEGRNGRDELTYRQTESDTDKYIWVSLKQGIDRQSLSQTVVKYIGWAEKRFEGTKKVGFWASAPVGDEVL